MSPRRIMRSPDASRESRWLGAAALGALATLVGTGAAIPAQQSSALPPIRAITRRIAVAADTFGNVSGVRQLSDGRLIVNDVGKRRLVILDSTLAHATVIADSTTGTQRAYGGTQGGIIPYRADSTIFVDPIAMSLLVVDPHGAIVRTFAAPRPADAPALSMPIGGAGLDAAGRLVYRNVRATCAPSFGCGFAIVATKQDTAAIRASPLPAWAWHDSVAIIRGTIATQTIDTLGFIATPFVANA
ncbi:MAG TPA: hypothetical protein VMH39_10730, partial [Gemmatimonadaceae bacterium]|nr:hypothetical protein [Gemmatimonadaceae bacterium]